MNPGVVKGGSGEMHVETVLGVKDTVTFFAVPVVVVDMLVIILLRLERLVVYDCEIRLSDLWN